MDVIVVFNGLGNQMSQYAFFLQKKAIHKPTYFITICKDHNGLELDKVFGIDCSQKPLFNKLLLLLLRISYNVQFNRKLKVVAGPLKLILKLFKQKVVVENFNYAFNSQFLKSTRGITFYYGGWHTEEYFKSVQDEVSNQFKFKRIPSDIANQEIIQKIKDHNSVSIHVRRGDYLNSENFNLFGDVCTKEYYIKAINLIKENITSPYFFVFSNDMGWVKANLDLGNATFVTCNNGSNSWKDMYLMSKCNHNIIANSSFSWWGAWLNKNSDKIVICPNRFLRNDTSSDIYPSSWIRVSN